MWHLRGAEPTDLEALTALVARCLEAGWGSGQLASALMASGARTRLGVDAATGALLGFVLARRIADVLEIDLVGVDPARRRQGIAAGLLGDLLAIEWAAGAGEARLELAAGNRGAQRLYAGLGFVVVGRRSRYYPDGDDALLLSRPASSS